MYESPAVPGNPHAVKHPEAMSGVRTRACCVGALADAQAQCVAGKRIERSGLPRTLPFRADNPLNQQFAP